MKKKKIVSVITIGLILSQITPIVAKAEPIDDVGNQVENKLGSKDKKGTDVKIDNKDTAKSEIKDEAKPEVKSDKEKETKVDTKTETKADKESKDELAFKDVVDKNMISNNDNVNWVKDYPDLINPNKKELIPVSFSAETMVKLDDTIKTLDELSEKNKFDAEKFNNVVKDFLQLNIDMSDDDAIKTKENDQFEYILFKAIYLGFTNTQGKDRDEFCTKIMDDIYISSFKRINSKKVGVMFTKHSGYLDSVLGEKYVKDERCKQILSYGASMMRILNTIVVDSDFKPLTDLSIPSTIKPTDVSGLNQIYDKNKKDKKPITQKDDNDTGHLEPILPDIKTKTDKGFTYVKGKVPVITSKEYIKKGDIPYIVTTYYNPDGSIKNITEERVGSNDIYYSIHDYNVIDGNLWNKKKSEQMLYQNVDKALDIWNSLSRNDLAKENKYTLQFTINAKDEKPFYYDSGIKASSKKTVTYNQLKDVLTQISLKVNGNLIEDKDKLLFIAEGKPLVLLDNKKEYSQEDVSNLLNSFENIKLNIYERQNGKQSLDKKLGSNDLKTIKIEDKKLKLNQTAILSNGILQLPLEEVSKELGFDVKHEDNKLTLTKDNLKIEYVVGSKSIFINGDEKIMSTPTQLKNNTIYGEYNLTSKQLGYNLSYNSDIGDIEFKK